MQSAQSCKPVEMKDDFARKLEDLKKYMKILKIHSPYQVLGVSDTAYDVTISSACLIKKAELEEEDSADNRFYYQACELARDILLDKFNRGRKEFPPQIKYTDLLKRLNLFNDAKQENKKLPWINNNAKSAIDELKHYLHVLGVANPYELLGVDRQATEVDIISRYEDLVKKEDYLASSDYVCACNLARNLLLMPVTRAHFDVLLENTSSLQQKPCS